MTIPACTNALVNNLQFGPRALDLLHSCDKWAALHIVAPFLAGMFTKTWWIVPIVAMIGEVGEYVNFSILGNFAIFASSNDVAINPNIDIESLANIFLSDIFLQGMVFATTLAWIYIQISDTPGLLSGRDFWKNPLKFWFYFFFLFGWMIIGPASVYGLQSGSYCYGITIALAFYIFGAIIVALVGPDQRGTPIKEKWIFFGSWFLPAAVLTIQNHFDYLYSGPVQSWLWAGILMLLGLVWAAYRWLPQVLKTIYFDYRF